MESAVIVDYIYSAPWPPLLLGDLRSGNEACGRRRGELALAGLLPKCTAASQLIYITTVRSFRSPTHPPKHHHHLHRFIATASYPTLHIHSPQIENHNLVSTAPPRTTSPPTVTRSDIGSIRQR